MDFDYKYLTDISPIGIIIIDIEGKILYVNHSFLIFSGFEPQELINAYLFKIFPQISHDIKHLPVEKLTSHDFEILCKDRSTKPALLTFRNLDDKNPETKIGIFVSDISQHKDALIAHKKNEAILKKKLVNLLSPDIYLNQIDISEIIDIGVLQKIQREFSKAFILASVITDNEGNFITKPSHLLELGHLENNELKEGCKLLDKKFFNNLPRDEYKAFNCNCSGCKIGAVPIVIKNEKIANWIVIKHYIASEVLTEAANILKMAVIEPKNNLDGVIQILRNKQTDFDTILKFLSQIAADFAELGYNNIKLAKEVLERQQIEYALMESELIFRELAENINDALILRSDDDLIYINPAFERIFEIKREKAFLTPNIEYEFVFPEDKKRIDEALITASKLKTKVFNEYFRIFTPNNNQKWIWLRSFPVMDENEKIYRTVTVAADITQRKTAEEALKKSEIELRELNATKDRFFSIIAHDLKNPFSSILGFARLMVDTSQIFDKQKTEFYAKQIFQSSSRAFELLENLLEWSRSQTGRLRYSPKDIDLSSIIMSSKNAVIGQAKIKDIDLNINVPGEIIVYADQDMISTVIRNLLSNAIKFTHNAGEVNVNTLALDEFIEVSVDDNGVGMSPEQQTKLFKIDEEIISLGTNNEKGTGLGLLLCKEFINKHGGHLYVSSQPGMGSRFAFTLPRFKVQ